MARVGHLLCQILRSWSSNMGGSHYVGNGALPFVA